MNVVIAHHNATFLAHCDAYDLDRSKWEWLRPDDRLNGKRFEKVVVTAEFKNSLFVGSYNHQWLDRVRAYHADRVVYLQG